MHRKDLLNEHIYDRERADEFMRKRAKILGLSRRQFIQLLVAGAGAAATVNLLPFRQKAAVAAAGQAIIKPAPPGLFLQSGSNLEMRWEAMYNRGYLVPNELFFVRNNSSVVPCPDPATWRLQVEGSGVSRPRVFSYDELLAMPSTSVIRALECAGNGRNFFEVSHGKKIAGTPWNLGGIGVAEWTGVPLREVLERAGVKQTARDVMPEGLDEKKVKRPMPIDKAMADDTLLVYAMNGQPLPPDHGFPMRMLVPGWVGIAHIKWIGRIEVSERPLYSEYNTNKYVLIGPDYKPHPPALGPMLTTQKVKSAFELPWNGEVPAGKRLLRGRSWSGEGRITKVEVSLDGGQTWQQARLREPNMDLAWVRWDVDWEVRPGTYKLQARATDSKGNTQPDRIPWNEEGYVHWAVVTHVITVK
ncbi:MAG: sulfite oxidase [Thermodesulfobacteriota bacterium]|jgi:DMSO/TMAO reductase YedYZ molybdopterin-dependent catalytic subunit